MKLPPCPISRACSRYRRDNNAAAGPSHEEELSEFQDATDCQDCTMEDEDVKGAEKEVETTTEQAPPPPDNPASVVNECDTLQVKISELTKELRQCLPEELAKETELRIARSQAYLNLSSRIRTIPASSSECRAIYAPDPEELATKALHDASIAERQLGARHGKALSARGDALFQLERYEEAREAYWSACQLGLSDGVALKQVAKCDELLAETPTARTKKPCLATEAVIHHCVEAKERLLQDLECTLCLKLLYEPVTTPCGHTFCRPCYARSTDHANRCPMCRTILHVGRKLPVSVVLKNMIERCFPEDYAARAAEEEEAAGLALAEDVSPLPLFIMSVTLPGERMALNIFEPRYRLMVRRAMEGNRRFGICVVDRSHNLAGMATEVEIQDCDPQPDGRFLIEIIGGRRFKPTNQSEKDGYRVAIPEFARDDPVEPDSPDAAALEAASIEVETMACTWADRLRTLGQSRGVCLELLRRAGEKPPRTEYERFSFWVGNLICPVYEDSSLKYRLLSTTSTLERMRMLRQVLQQVRDVQLCGGCSVM